MYSISDIPLDHIYKTLVYPVPVKGAHFLGVHSTITVDGYVKVGPTVSPAFSIENYHGLQNVNVNEALGIIGNYIKLLFSD
jgi:L-2-hydroxyglutarate oxidase LhgO